MTQTHSIILRRIAQVHQDNLAKEVGLSTTQVNRIVADENGIKLSLLGQFLGSLGLRVVEDNGDKVVIDRQEYEAVARLAAKYLSSQCHD